MQTYFLTWQQGFEFSGQSSRQEFWTFMAIHLLVSIGCILSDIVLKTWFDIAYSILSFIPLSSAIVRRLHDIGKSGYWAFCFFIPIIGPFLLFYWLIQPSHYQVNKGVSV